MKTHVFRFAFFILLLTVPALGEPAMDYIFETIEVPGVDFLELTSTNDHGIMRVTPVVPMESVWLASR